MVSRPVFQRLLEWMQTNMPADTGQTGDMTDEVLKAQAIQDPAQVKNLIEIERARAENTRRLETARGEMKLKLVTRLIAAGLVALAVLVVAALFVIDKAARLKLPWPPVGTSALTVVGAGLSSAVAWWVRRAVIRRRAARTSAANPPESRTEGDQNPVGAP
ncbi:hypothetical protein ACIQI8_36555 [Streptomyces sp. NPDC092369]|uniref:hypothetical protein n=1 Tax=Streptomyces sp. NPDC092369 TaxID=3366015 RepID=UPI00381054AA